MAHIDKVILFCIFNFFIFNSFSQILSVNDDSELVVENFIAERLVDIVDISITYQKSNSDWEYLGRRLMTLNGFFASIDHRYINSSDTSLSLFYLFEVQNDTIFIVFRTSTKGGNGYLRELSQTQDLLDSGCVVMFSKVNKDTAIIMEFDNVTGIDAYLATHQKKNKYKILSKLGETNSCGLIHCKIPYDKRIAVVFQKPESKYAQLVRFRRPKKSEKAKESKIIPLQITS